MRCSLGLTLVAVVLTGMVAEAQTGVGVQNQIFTVPSGWSRAPAGPGVLLTPATAPNLVTLFLVGRPLGGQTLRAAFEQDCRGMSQGLRVVNTGPLEARDANGVELLSVTAELRNARGIASYRNYVAAGPSGRIEMLVYTAATPQLFQRYLPEVAAFVARWSFANLAPMAPAPAAAEPSPPSRPTEPAATQAPSPASSGSRFDAVYSGLKVSSALRFGVVTDTYTFLADGTVCHCLPINGILGFNVAEELRSSPEFVGQYQIEDDRITLTLARGTYRRTGVLSKERIVMDGQPYELRGDPGQIGPHPLDGVFVRADRSSPDVARRSIRFTSGGQFQDRGIVESVATTIIINGNPVPERPAGTGTYDVSRYTLTLRYADGYVRRLPITTEPSNLSKPGLKDVVVNTYALISR